MNDSFADVTSEALKKFRGEFLTELRSVLLSAMTPEQQVAVSSIPIGLINIRTLNAQAIRAPNGRPLIVLNQGLFGLTSHWWEARMGALEVSRQSGPAAMERYLIEMYSFVLLFWEKNGLVDYPQDFVIVRPDVLKGCIISAVQTELFVLAHEYAHVLAGDLNGANTRSIAPDDALPASELTVIETSHEREYAADRNGFQLYLAAWPTFKWSTGTLNPKDVTTPLHLFGLLAFIEKNATTPDRFATHPPALDRLVNIIGPILTHEPENDGQRELREDAEALAVYVRDMPNMVEYFTRMAEWIESSDRRPAAQP
jgi:hypothetical protein